MKSIMSAKRTKKIDFDKLEADGLKISSDIKSKAKNKNGSALYEIGNKYYTSKPPNFDKAILWIKESAESNYHPAMFRLGYMYENGEGVKKDNKRAMNWYLKASNYDNVEAQLRAGAFYENGTGVARNYKLAMEHYLKAAEQNNRDAQFNIGWMFYDGKGVLQNHKTALHWFVEADKQGHPQAKIFINKARGRTERNVGSLDYTGSTSPKPPQPSFNTTQTRALSMDSNIGAIPDLAEIEKLRNDYTRILSELNRTEALVRRFSHVDASTQLPNDTANDDMTTLPMLIEEPLILEQNKLLYEEPMVSESLNHDDPANDIIFDSQGEESSTNGDFNYDSSES